MNTDELLAGYILGDLDPEEQQAFIQLLRERPDLAQQVEQLQETLGLLPYGLPDPEPSPQLKTRILTAAVALNRRLRPNRWTQASPWVALAASLVAVWLGFDSYQMRQQLAQQVAITTMLQTSGTRLVAFKPMEHDMATTGSMVITPGDSHAVLVLKGVPSLPVGKVYRLWAVAGPEKIGCGQFSPNAQGEVWVKVALDDKLAQRSLVVTLESMDAPMQPTGPMVLTSTS